MIIYDNYREIIGGVSIVEKVVETQLRWYGHV